MNKKIGILYYLFIPTICSMQCIYNKDTLRNNLLRFIISYKHPNYKRYNKIDFYTTLQIKYAEIFNRYYTLPEKDRIFIETIKDLVLQ